MSDVGHILRRPFALNAIAVIMESETQVPRLSHKNESSRLEVRWRVAGDREVEKGTSLIKATVYQRVIRLAKRALLLLRDCPRPQEDSAFQRDQAPNQLVDGSAVAGSVSVWFGSPISDL